MKMFVNSLRLCIKNNVVFLIFLIAFLVRLGFVINETGIPSSDAASYDSLGLSISKGYGYIYDNGIPDSFRPPFYPAFLAIIYKFFGHSYFAVRFIQSIIGALTAVFVFLIGRKIYGFFIGLLASFVSIAYLPFIKSSCLLLTENIFTFILILIVFYLIKIQKNGKFGDSIVLGLLLGISLLTRSTMALFILFIMPVFIHSKDLNFAQCSKKYAVVLLFFTIVLSPWIIRNYIVYRALVPVSSQGGIGFYSSYCPRDGIFGLMAASDDPVVIEASKISSPILQSNFFVKKTIDFIINNPKKVLMLELKKVMYFWAPLDWEIVGNKWFNAIYMIMLPFFAIGFISALKEFRKFYPVLIPIVYFQIISLIFYGSPRFRLPVDPYIFIIGMAGIMEVFKYLKKTKGNYYENINSYTCF